jgi:hypothetical protein
MCTPFTPLTKRPLITESEMFLPTNARARYANQINNYFISLINARSWQAVASFYPENYPPAV